MFDQADSHPGLPHKNKLSIPDQLYMQIAVEHLNIHSLRLYLPDCGVTGELTDEIVLGIAHRARLGLIHATPKMKADSEEYLKKKGLL